MSARPRVVIVGAGFGGLACARRLEGGPVDVTIVDRHNYHLFTPLLYQVASALLNPSDIAFPIRKVFRSSPNVIFRQGEVTHIDFDARTVQLGDDHALPYDWLVIAPGTVTHFFGIATIERRALGLKTLSEAMQLRNHILSCLETAAREQDEEAQRPLMTFAIAGGGPTGVEFAGALAELMRLILVNEYPTIRVPARIVLCEGRDQLLSMFTARLGAYTKKRLERLGVEVRLGTLIQTSDDGNLQLSDGTALACRTLVWSAGVRSVPVAAALDADFTARSRRIAVDPHLRIVRGPAPGEPLHSASGPRSRVPTADDEARGSALRVVANAFAIGDASGFVQDGAELAMLSAPAMQQGRYVGDYILTHLADRPGDPVKLPAFHYLDKGTMATVGRNAAVVDIRGFSFTGFVAWLAWLAIHIYYLIGYRNRLVVLWGWAWNYVWYDRPVRIIAEAAGPPKLPPIAGSR